jgi:hypothetical protein
VAKSIFILKNAENCAITNQKGGGDTMARKQILTHIDIEKDIASGLDVPDRVRFRF